MPKPKSHAFLGLINKGRATKELVVYRKFDFIVIHIYKQELVQRYTKMIPLGVSRIHNLPRLNVTVQTTEINLANQ